MKKLTVISGLFLLIAPMALIGCGSGEEAPKVDPNAPPPQSAPPAQSGKAQGGVQAPGIKEETTK